jgi:hypothetical protein
LVDEFAAGAGPAHEFKPVDQAHIAIWQRDRLDYLAACLPNEISAFALREMPK